MKERKRTAREPGHPPLGGAWTDRKLEVISKYLHAYTTALKGKPVGRAPFRKAYIDAFAGTGYREARYALHPDSVAQELLFPDLAEPEPQALLDGSARLALKTSPPFDKYVFIERSVHSCEQLDHLKVEFPDLADTIDIQQGDANALIQRLCRKDWRSRRAVMFLDPYGMQVEWKTIESIAKTNAIDLWLLFPLGIGVNRLLKRSGNIPPEWRKRLDLILGTDEWYEEFYRLVRTPTLFGDDDVLVTKATTQAIGRFFNERLSKVFAGVAKPGVLKNSTNCPLYLLCFAVGSESGRPTALSIAGDLLKGVH